MTDPTDYQNSDTQLKSITPVIGSSIIIQKIVVNRYGIRLYVTPYTKYVTFAPTVELQEKKDLIFSSTTLYPGQNFIPLKTAYNHPEMYGTTGKKENNDEDILPLKLKEGDSIGILTQILDINV